MKVQNGILLSSRLQHFIESCRICHSLGGQTAKLKMHEHAEPRTNLVPPETKAETLRIHLTGTFAKTGSGITFRGALNQHLLDLQKNQN